MRPLLIPQLLDGVDPSFMSRLNSLFQRMTFGPGGAHDDELADLLAEADQLTTEAYERVQDGVADLLRAQRGEEVWS